jgi:YVTN family beta-propeller protein
MHSTSLALERLIPSLARSPRAPRPALASWLAAARRLVLLIAGTLVVGSTWAASFAYVPQADSKAVAVIDTSTDQVVATVTVGDKPYGVAINPAGTRVYVGSLNDGTVSVIDTSTNQVIGTVVAGAGNLVQGIVVSPDGTRVYAVVGNNTVAVIDASTNTVVGAPIPVPGNPIGLAVSPSGDRVYTANFGGDSVSIIDTTSTPAQVTSVALGAGKGPVDLVLDAGRNRLYVVNNLDRSLSVVNTQDRSVTTPVTNLAGGSNHVALDPGGTFLYVASLSGSLSVINTADFSVTTVPFALPTPGPNGVSLNRSGSKVYIANDTPGTVRVLNAADRSVAAVIPLAGARALGAFIGPDLAPPVPAPTLSQWALTALAAGLALLGVGQLRRRVQPARRSGSS